MERIGIYGGTFNPPHLGHIQAAKEALTALELDRLLLVPTHVSPHKAIPTNSPTPRQRLEMLQLAVAGEPKIQVCDLELNREGVSYTYETVLQLRKEYPQAQLVLLMGTDMFLSFFTWRHPEILLEHTQLGVFYRGDRQEVSAVAAQKAALEAQGAKVNLVQNRVIPISSTQLRRLLAFRCADDFLPQVVGDYIRANGLYHTGANWRGLPEEELEKIVISLLKPSRVNHVLGCRDTAVALARCYGADETDAARAGLLHDITKALDGPLQLTLCRGYGKILDDFSIQYPKTLHALTGSMVAQRIFGENEQVISAIRWHTTGRADMNLLEKIVYIADYMEPNRDFPGVERLRALAYTDLDAALKLGLEMTMVHVENQGNAVSPESQQALAWLNHHQKG